MTVTMRAEPRWPLAGKFRGLIKALGYLSYSEAAAVAGVPQSQLARYVRGHAQPTAPVLDRMLAGLGATRAQLLAARPLAEDAGICAGGRGGRRAAPRRDLGPRLAALIASKGFPAWGVVAKAVRIDCGRHGVRSLHPGTFARYLAGSALPQPKVLDAILEACGGTRAELRSIRPVPGLELPEEERP